MNRGKTYHRYPSTTPQSDELVSFMSAKIRDSGMGLDELSDRTGIAKRSLIYMLSGEHTPNLAAITLILDELDCKLIIVPKQETKALAKILGNWA
jgi:DNA-binding phage protein